MCGGTGWYIVALSDTEVTSQRCNRMIQAAVLLSSSIGIFVHQFSLEKMVIEATWISTIGSTLLAIIDIFGKIAYSGIEDELMDPPLIIFGLILIYQCSIITTFAAYTSYINDVYMLKLGVYILFNIILALIFYRIPKST